MVLRGVTKVKSGIFRHPGYFQAPFQMSSRCHGGGTPGLETVTETLGDLFGGQLETIKVSSNDVGFVTCVRETLVSTKGLLRRMSLVLSLREKKNGTPCGGIANPPRSGRSP